MIIKQAGNELHRYKWKFQMLLNTWINSSKKYKWEIMLINFFVPLLIGLFIYILFIPTAHVSKFIYSLFDNSFTLNRYNSTNMFLSCYLADMLWGYALMSILLPIIVEKPNDLYKALGICLVFEMIIEFLQLTPVLDGTFDLFDILFEFLSSLSCLLIIMLCSKRVNIKAAKNSQNL